MTALENFLNKISSSSLKVETQVDEKNKTFFVVNGIAIYRKHIAEIRDLLYYSGQSYRLDYVVIKDKYRREGRSFAVIKC